MSAFAQGQQLKSLRNQRLAETAPGFRLLEEGSDINRAFYAQGKPLNPSCCQTIKSKGNPTKAIEPFGGFAQVEATNASRSTASSGLINRLNTQLSSYSSAFRNLMTATDTYLKTAGTGVRNRNIYVVKTAPTSDLSYNLQGCYKYPPAASSANLWSFQTDLGNDVSVDTCKLRAADLGRSVFGLRNDTGGCYVSDDVTTATSYGRAYKTMTSYSLSEVTNADTAALMLNGQISTFKNNDSGVSPVLDLSGVPQCNRSYGGKIAVATASYGTNCK